MNSTFLAEQLPANHMAEASAGHVFSRRCVLAVFVAGSSLMFGCGSGGDIPAQSSTAASTPPVTTPPTTPPTTIPPDTTTPSVPGSPSATVTGATSINVVWQASTDNVGVTGYSLELCQGVGCTDFTPIAAPSGTSFTSSGLSAATTYRYRVRARDAAANFSAYSTVATATTPAAPPPSDTTPPTQPSNFSATADGPFGINLAWQASTDNVGVSGYSLERCLGTACTNFSPIASPSGASFADSGLSSGTDYRYRVRAIDVAGNLSAFSTTAAATTATQTAIPPVTLPTWVSALSSGQWFEIPNTSISAVQPSPIPSGNTGPQSKVLAWNSFVADTRTSSVLSVANGGHADYGGNEVDRLDLESETPAWVQLLAPTPNDQLVQSATHYADGRPTSRHSYYGATLNASGDRIMILGGSRWGNGFGLGTLDSYNISGNNYSAASTHPNIPSAITALLAFATSANPANGDIFVFGNSASARWNRAANSWSLTSASGSPPYGYEAMSAMDTTRNRILILGGLGNDRHLYNTSTNSFSQITLSGANASNVSGRSQGALVYVEAIDRFLVRFSGSGGIVYQIHPSTFEVTTFAPVGSGSVPSTVNGPYNKFLYLPRLGGAAYIPSYTGNVWFLRIH